MVSIFILFLFSACGTTLKHIPSQSLNGLTVEKSVNIMVADIGDARVGESPDRIGQGVSYILPVSFYARDSEGKKMPVSHYIAQSLSEDLQKLGYNSKLANDNNVRTPLTLKQAISTAKNEEIDYLVTTKVTDGKTNFWGFILIPFVEPVWTRIRYDCKIIDIKSETTKNISFETTRKETEWYFAKVTIFDAIFDAGLFGKHWHRTAWGKTVVSDALAETALKISEEIQTK